MAPDVPGMPLSVHRFLTDAAMYGTSHQSCCAFHASQRLRVLAFLHFWQIGPPGLEKELLREIEWYAACDEYAPADGIGARLGCSCGCATFVPDGSPMSWADPRFALYQQRAGTVYFSGYPTHPLLSIGLGSGA